jgi:hypothetical protein
MTSYLVSVKQAFHKEALSMPQRLELALRRVLEVVLLATTGWTLLRGQVSATALGAIVPVLIAVSVTLDWLNRGRRGHCIPSHGGGK